MIKSLQHHFSSKFIFEGDAVINYFEKYCN